METAMRRAVCTTMRKLTRSAAVPVGSTGQVLRRALLQVGSPACAATRNWPLSLGIHRHGPELWATRADGALKVQHRALSTIPRRDALNSVTNADRLIKLVVEDGESFNRHDVCAVYKKLAELLKNRQGSPKGLEAAIEQLKQLLVQHVKDLTPPNVTQVMRAIGEMHLYDEEVIVLLLERMKQHGIHAYHPPQMITLLWVLAKGKKFLQHGTCSDSAAELAAQLASSMPEITPNRIGSVVWSVGILRIDNAELRNAIETHVATRLSEYNTFNIIQVISSLPRVPGTPDPELLAALQARLVEQADTIRSRSVGGIFWGLASMAAEPHPEIVPLFTKVVVDDPSEIIPFRISSMLWSLVRWEQEAHADDALLLVLDTAARRAHASSWSPQSVANILWALSRGKAPPDTPLLQFSIEKAREMLPTFNHIEVTQCLHAIVVADWDAPDLVDAFAASCRTHAHDFEVGVVASALSALALRQFRKQGEPAGGGEAWEATIEALLQRLEVLTEQCEAREVQGTMFAMAASRVGDEAVFDSIVRRLDAVKLDLTTSGLCSVLWSLAMRTAGQHNTDTQAVLPGLTAQLVGFAPSLAAEEKEACAWALQVLGVDPSSAEATALAEHGLAWAAGGSAGGSEEVRAAGAHFVSIGSATFSHPGRGFRVAQLPG